jgi:tungstate transport system ATP-binding protein
MAEAPMFPLEARGVSVVLGGHPALDDVDFAFDGSRRLVVLGANGAGKSVLLRVLHGLVPPTRGEIRWAGGAPRPRAQAMVFQRPVMLRRSALANVEYALRMNGHGGWAARRRAGDALQLVGLAHIASRPARVLSGGEQQRLALARAWSLRPRLMFLDEPTASLDPASAQEVERLVGEINAQGAAIVMTTHNLGFARRMADDILFLDKGRVAEHSPAQTFFDAPRSPEAVHFLKAELPWTVPSNAP